MRQKQRTSGRGRFCPAGGNLYAGRLSEALRKPAELYQNVASHENIFVSAEAGAEKPDRKIFDYAKKKMRLEEMEIWFVGDAYPLDVEGALNAGWNAVWMNRRNREMPEQGKNSRQEKGRMLCVRSEEELSSVLRGLLQAAEN